MHFLDTEPVHFGWEQVKKHIPADALSCVSLCEDAALESQCYHLQIENGNITLRAGDSAGMLYGLLDLPDFYHGRWPQTLVREQKPYLENRGIKFNIPLDARTPSYSDASTSAYENIGNVWDWDFWTEYLDSMALQKYNVLSLWNLSPFPSLVRIPEYPAVALNDVVRSNIPPRADMSGDHMWTPDMVEGACIIRKMTMDEKIDFWQRVMAYAQSRCIHIYIFTWNLFTYGTEGNPYGITCDQRNPITKDYLYCATKALLETYPLLAGIGITSGENMARDDTDIPFLRSTYGRAVEDICAKYPERKVELIHRMQYARYPEIRQQYQSFGGTFSVSFKYSQAHLHSYAEPAFFSDFLKSSDSAEKFWLTLRDDDYYFYRWYDYGFAREFFQKMAANRLRGFYLGADGFTWGRDYTGYGDRHPLYLQKMWAKFALFGQLAYCPDKEEACFLRLLESRLGPDSMGFASLWTAASTAFRTLQAVHWNDYDFQWYPEGCCQFLHPPVGKLVFTDINEFMNRPAMPGTPFVGVGEYCKNVSNSISDNRHTPMEAVSTLRSISARTANLIEYYDGDPTSERTATLLDIRALHLLSTYYADKLEAAVELCFYRMDRSQTYHQEKAIALLKTAAETWKTYSSFSRTLYRPQRMTRMGGNTVDFTAFDRSAEADVELAMYQ